MARFYSNENFPLPVVVELRKLGHDVLTTLEANRANQRIPDEQVLNFATENQRAVLTLNRRDFFRLHAAISSHAGIIFCTFDANYLAQAERISLAVQQYTSLVGQIIRINRP